MKYYLLHIWGDVEPIVKGPYKTDTLRLRAAKRVRHADPDLRDGLYRINIDKTLTVEPFGGAELEVGHGRKSNADQ